MIKLSASTIKDYLSCPRKVFYRFNHPELGVQTEAMAIGSAIHEIIEKKELDAIRPIMSKFGLESDYAFDKIKLCLDNFSSVFGHLVGEGDEIEKYFKLKFADDITISGKIDRVHNNVLVDWKTGASKPANLSNDIQFIIYYLAYKMLYKKEPTAVIYASLFHNKIHIFKPNNNSILKFQEDILPYVYNGVKYKVFPRIGLYHWQKPVCRNCQYKKFCLEE